MTFIAGIRRGNELIFVADSAVSSPTDLMEDKYSYFEQLQKQEPNNVVDEAAIKIVTLSDQEVVSFAGDLHTGLNCIEFLRDYKKLEVQQRLTSLASSLGPFVKHVDLLLGVAGEKTDLFVWRSRQPDLIDTTPDGAVCCFGSGDKLLRQTIQNLLRNWHLNPADDLMVILSAGLQASAQHQNTVSAGVGGMFAALTLSTRGYKWIPDINFLTYGPDNFTVDGERSRTLNVVSSFLREGTLALCTRSPALKSMLKAQLSDQAQHPLRVKILASITDYDDGWWKRWGQEIDDNTDKLSGAYFAFLSRAEPRAVIVQAHNNQMMGNMAQATVEDGQFRLITTSEFLTHILPEQPIGTVSKPAIVLVQRSVKSGA